MNITVKVKQRSDRLSRSYQYLLWPLIAAAFCFAPYSEARANYAEPISTPAFGIETPHSMNHYRLAHADNQITMREAIKRAKRRFPGKVLAAKRTINRQGNVIYRIKIISNSSEIRTISIAADR